MALRIEWDKFEVALLIDACERVQQKRIIKPEMVSQLSSALRRRAERNGTVIDDIFRNENGISLQMTKMDYLLTDGSIGLPGASKLYAEMAQMRKNNPEGYTQLLKEAKKQISEEEEKTILDNKVQFKQWLSSNPSSKYSTDIIIQALDDASSYCRSHSVCKDSFWDIDDKAKFTAVTSKLLGMRFYRLMHRPTAIVLDKAVPLYKKYLESAKMKTLPSPDRVIPSDTHSDSESSKPVEVIPSQDDRTKLYQKLFAVSRVYDDPSGLTISKIINLLGNAEDEQQIRDILDDSSWATKISSDTYSFSRQPVSDVHDKDAPIKSESVRTVTNSGFYDYLHNECGLADATCRSYVSAIRGAENYAQNQKLIPNKIYNTTVEVAVQVIQSLLGNQGFLDIDTQMHNRFSAAFTKFTEYVGQSSPIPLSSEERPSVVPGVELEDYDKEKFQQVLLQRYRNGMMFDSIDFDIFRETYEMLFEEQLPFDDSAIEARLRNCGILYKDRLFPADGIIDPETRKKLFEYIDGCFASGKTVLYYKAIFADLASELTSCYTLADEEMLRAYIEFTSEKGKYYLTEKYLSVEKNVVIDHNAEVADYLLSAGKPMTIEAVASALSHIPQEQVQSIIYFDKRFLRNSKGEFFHKDIFEVSDEELNAITNIINGYIDENEYAIWTDVWNQIKEKMPVFLENNLYLSWLGVRNAIAPFLSKQFNFNASVISAPEKHYEMKDIFQLYAKHHPTFSADDIYALSKELDTPVALYLWALAEVSVRVSYDLFVSKDQITFDLEAVDKAIGSFMAKDYICLREIDSFLAFPNVGYEWNEYLLESYVLSFSKKFKLLNNGMALNNAPGAIVKKDGAYTEFVDVCAAVLADSYIELKKDAALNYLADRNMITQRRYKNIELAIQKAGQIRARKR